MLQSLMLWFFTASPHTVKKKSQLKFLRLTLKKYLKKQKTDFTHRKLFLLNYLKID